MAEKHLASAKTPPRRSDASSSPPSGGSELYILLVTGSLVLIFGGFRGGDYLAHLTVMIGIYSLLAYSMNLVVGFGGLLTFCHAGLFGIGAYTYALATIEGSGGALTQDLAVTAGLSSLEGMILAVGGTAVVGCLIGLAVLRFRRDLFIVATLAFQMIIFVVLLNATALSGGPYGIVGIPRPTIFGWTVTSSWRYVGLVGVSNLVVLAILYALTQSIFGLRLKALRDNERAAESLGISGFRQYLVAFTIAASVAGLAGGLYASYVTYIDPGSFSLRETIFLVTLLLLGGTGNMLGPFVGVCLMLLLPEALRAIGLPDGMAANVHAMLYGLILIAAVYFRPQGLVGSYKVR